MSGDIDYDKSVLWGQVVLHGGAMVRAHRRAYVKIHEEFSGAKGRVFPRIAQELADDISLVKDVIEGKKGGLKIEPIPGGQSVCIFTDQHKFIFSKPNDAADFYLPATIFRRH